MHDVLQSGFLGLAQATRNPPNPAGKMPGGLLYSVRRLALDGNPAAVPPNYR